MADITMCTTEGCPLAGSCKRKLASPSDVQSTALFHFMAAASGAECDHHYPVQTATKNEALVQEFLDVYQKGYQDAMDARKEKPVPAAERLLLICHPGRAKEYIRMGEVVAFIASDKYIFAIHERRGGLFLGGVTSLKKLLNGGELTGFVRAHRNALVRQKAAVGAEQDAEGQFWLILSNGTKIEVSRRHKAEWRRMLAAGVVAAAIQELAAETASLDPDAMRQRVAAITLWGRGV